MRKVILYIAMSLDGYIADDQGHVDWLEQEDEAGQDSYDAFVKKVDTVVMGWTTYHQIITQLSKGEWVYENLISYVITHRNLHSMDNIQFVQEDPCTLIKKLRQENGKDIWICGGSHIIQPLLQENLIDEFHISIAPILLGSGLRLFEDGFCTIKLNLVHTQVSHGLTELVYTRK